MGHCKSLVAVLGVVASLAGCAAHIPFEGDRSKDRIARDLGIRPDLIVRQDRCVVAHYAGRSAAPGFECIYIATAAYAAVLDFDPKAGEFKEALHINTADSIAFVTRRTVIAELVQMQVRH